MKNILVICFAVLFGQTAFAQETTTAPVPEAPKKACCAASAQKDGKACCAKGTEKAASCNHSHAAADTHDDHETSTANAATDAPKTTAMVKKTAVVAGAKQSAEFKVWGNCGMCKKTIEKAAKGIAGVESASWNVDTHQFSVVFDPAKTNARQVHQAIADAGYDTDLLKGNDTAYNNLHACCQYERKAQ